MWHQCDATVSFDAKMYVPEIGQKLWLPIGANRWKNEYCVVQMDEPNVVGAVLNRDQHPNYAKLSTGDLVHVQVTHFRLCERGKPIRLVTNWLGAVNVQAQLKLPAPQAPPQKAAPQKPAPPQRAAPVLQKVLQKRKFNDNS